MTRHRNHIPKYRHHKPTGQAVVTLDGRDIYLGLHGSEISRLEYDRLVAQWMANGRRLPHDGEQSMTVNQLILAYADHAESYYVKDGKPTPEIQHIKVASRMARKLYGHRCVVDFGPLALKACRMEFLETQCRKTANQNADRLRRMFRWGVENEMVPGEVWHRLKAVRGLPKGRGLGRESEPVRPVPEEDVEAVLPHVSAAVGGMIRVQLLTGMRPGEVISMRGVDIDRSVQPWRYRPEHHKTEHHGHQRVVPLGPKAQEILRPFLETAGDGYLFSPRQAEEARNAKRKLARRTPMTPSQRARKRKKGRKRAWREHYDVASYRRAIRRACEKAGVSTWTPHRLRHTAATRLRREFGIEAARVVLGHRSAEVTEIYAEMDREMASEVMGRVG
jgi:integrase